MLTPILYVGGGVPRLYGCVWVRHVRTWVYTRTAGEWWAMTPMEKRAMETTENVILAECRENDRAYWESEIPVPPEFESFGTEDDFDVDAQLDRYLGYTFGR